MISQATFARYASDPASFRADLLVDVSGNVKRFGDIMKDWQAADFSAIDPALSRACGRADNPEAKMRVWLERGRGSSKTSDIAVMATWSLVFSTRPIKTYIFAADKDQAKLLKAAVEGLIRLNQWLSGILTVNNDTITNTADGHPGKGGFIKVESSDVASSWGLLADVIFLEEFCHWEANAQPLWESTLTTASKRTNCLLVLVTNSGFTDSWQHQVFQNVRLDPAWHFSHLDGSRHSLLSQERISELKRLLPPTSYSRLVECCWANSAGDALRRDDIDHAFSVRLMPMLGNEPGYRFAAGVDLGVSRNASAVVCLGIHDSGKIKMAASRLWKPEPGKKVDLADVEKFILTLDQVYDLQHIALDPWQAELMAQRLEAATTRRRRDSWLNPNPRRKSNLPLIREIPATGANLREQASLVLQSFADKRLELFGEELKKDLLALRAVEKSYGLRLESPVAADGTHGDTFSAFALALLVGTEIAGKKTRVAGVPGKGPLMNGFPPDPTRLEHMAAAVNEQNAGQVEMMRQMGLLRQRRYF